MESTEFDTVPLLAEEPNGETATSATNEPPTRKRSVRFRNPAATTEEFEASPRHRRDPFDLTDEEFEKLSLFRAQAGSSGAFTAGGVFWMVASIWTLYYTQLPIVIKADERVDWSWMYLAIAMLVVCLSTASYFIVYLSWWKKVSQYYTKHLIGFSEKLEFALTVVKRFQIGLLNKRSGVRIP